MSNNISHCQVVKCNLTITRKDFKKVTKQCQNDFPEYCFIEDIIKKIDRDEWDEKLPEIIHITKPTWIYMGSGDTLEPIFLKKIVPLTQGEAELIYTFEGNTHQGVLIRNGKYRFCPVEIKLVKPNEW